MKPCWKQTKETKQSTNKDTPGSHKLVYVGKTRVLQCVWTEMSCMLDRSEWSPCVCQQHKRPHYFSLAGRRAARSQENKSSAWDSGRGRTIYGRTLGHVVEVTKSRRKKWAKPDLTQTEARAELIRIQSLASWENLSCLSAGANLAGCHLPLAHLRVCDCSPRTFLAFGS